ncbi:carboxylesterase/lipase family protein [Embleya sp. NPDC050493]|uniref:carboxylesterase/lipase family protein n=1 Tax=Embleya sp. NPDC050493 TaxID=3363989 RepID=UPI003789164D
MSNEWNDDNDRRGYRRPTGCAEPGTPLPRSTVVTTDRGRIRGVDEGPVRSFRGIPYAASPVGDLRFAPPRPHAYWAGVRDTVCSGPSVPQGPSRLELVVGPRTPDWSEEDCLTLNVWTPCASGASRPVLVWFHGGGFTSGCGGWDWYDGARLAALGDIVVVTANYRLGPLGFLYRPEMGADNLGLRDQGAVLRWVYDNVAAFGGDPHTITVGGQSAGAWTSLLLAVDPETGPLIRRVLAQSSPLGLAEQSPDAARAAAAKYFGALGPMPDDDLAAGLRALPVEQLVRTYAGLVRDTAVTASVAPPMYPVLGGFGVRRGLREAVREGALADKDVLIGTTREEAAAFFGFKPSVREAGRGEVLRMLRDEGGRVYDRYAGRRPEATPGQVFADVMSDRVFHDGTRDVARARAWQGHPAYLYRFDRPIPAAELGLGAPHCAELPYLFGTFDAFADSVLVRGADRVAAGELFAAFGGALAAFVATGSPNGAGLETWKPHGPNDAETMFFE